MNSRNGHAFFFFFFKQLLKISSLNAKDKCFRKDWEVNAKGIKKAFELEFKP
jgi:hypothetical protein